MAYSPENNPYIPGDPYSYDLKWMVKKINEWKDPLDSAERAKASEDAAAASAEAAADSAQDSADSASRAADIANTITDPVAGIVADWLADNITQPTTPAIDASLTVEGAAADAKAAGDAIRNNSAEVSALETAITSPKNYTEGYYINISGVVLPMAGYSLSEYIDVSNLTGVLFWYGTYDAYVKCALYDAAKNIIDVFGGLSGSEYRNINVSSGSYIRFSFPSSYEARVTSSYTPPADPTVIYWKKGRDGEGMTKTLEYLKNGFQGSRQFYAHADTLTSGNALEIPYDINIKYDKAYHFKAYFTSFAELWLGQGNDTYSEYYKIDNTNITLFTNSIEGSSFAHGLTLADYIEVVIITKPEITELYIYTNGGYYHRSMNIVQGYRGLVYIRPVGMTLTNASAAFTAKALKKPIWFFGNSYITYTSPSRWPYYLRDAGLYQNVMLSGYPGQNSLEALEVFKGYLTVARPAIVVWAMGMNDPDYSGIISGNWKDGFYNMQTICREMGITLILATIPNVPSYTNYYKNQFIKASGYRYIDFAQAVGAEAIGSTWYPGMLSPDNTHPSEAGAAALYTQVITDLPEILAQ